MNAATAKNYDVTKYERPSITVDVVIFSILDEMRFLHKNYVDISVETLLNMGTLNGALALGWDDKIGCLSSGKEADLIAIPLDDPQSKEPLVDILDAASGCPYAYAPVPPHAYET